MIKENCVLFDLIEDFCLLVSNNGVILDVNQYCLHSLKTKKENITGIQYDEFLSKFQILVSKQSICLENEDLTCLKSEEGDLFFTKKIEKESLLDGKSMKYVLFRDYTKCINAEERFRKAFDNSSLIMAISEIETGLYVDVNKAFCQILEYDYAEIVGYPSSELNLFVNYEQRNEVIQLMNKNGTVSNYEIKARTKNGKILDGLFCVDIIKVGKKKYLLTSMNDITDLVNARNQIKDSKTNFKNFFHTVDDFFFILDKNGSNIYSNKAVKEKLGYTSQELETMNVLELHLPEHRKEASVIIEKMLKGETKVCPLPLLSKSGYAIPVETRVWPGKWYDKNVLFGISKDMTAETLALEKFRKLFEFNPSPILICDRDNLKIIQANNVWIDKLGWDVNLLKDKQFIDYLCSDNYGLTKKIQNLICQSGKVMNIQGKIKSKTGKCYDALISADSFSYMDRKYTFIVFTDISELIENREQIEYLSYHDALTGLYNRTYYNRYVEEYDNKENLPLSIIMGDVNGLKLMNDVFGHRVGDELLKTIYENINGECRKTDTAFRWGGDEFIIFLPRTRFEEASIIMQRIREKCVSSEYTFINGQEKAPSISMGVSTKKSINEEINQKIREAEDKMYHSKLLESTSIHSTIMTSMKKTLYEKSNETKKHSERLEKLCIGIAKELNLPNEDIEDLRMLALLHDIGKIAVDDRILLKNGPLDDEEWKEMKKHSELGYRIAQSSPEIAGIAKYILSHHERWDGKGYPQGLKGKEIPLLSRILSVVDSFDAMTEERVYRKAISKQEALEEVEQCSGTQFDPQIVDAFCMLIT